MLQIATLRAWISESQPRDSTPCVHSRRISVHPYRPHRREPATRRHSLYLFYRQSVAGIDKLLLFPKSMATISHLLRNRPLFRVLVVCSLYLQWVFARKVPVQNRQREKDGAPSPSYGVSPQVPSCKAIFKQP